MLSKIIVPGDKAELQRVVRVKMDDTEDNRRVYHSKVCEIVSEDRLEITMPIEKGKLLLLQVDGEYDVYFFTENGLYQCYARVLDRYKSNNIYMVLMEITSNLRKQQRREFYRFGCAIELGVCELREKDLQEAQKKNESLELTGEKLDKGVIVDISGGGLRFVSEMKYDADSHVFCKYHLLIEGKYKEYNLIGKVLSVGNVENRPGAYEHRIKYVNINVEEREEIIRYIFQEERKSRKKELGLE